MIVAGDELANERMLLREKVEFSYRDNVDLHLVSTILCQLGCKPLIKNNWIIRVLKNITSVGIFMLPLAVLRSQSLLSQTPAGPPTCRRVPRESHTELGVVLEGPMPMKSIHLQFRNVTNTRILSFKSWWIGEWTSFPFGKLAGELVHPVLPQEKVAWNLQQPGCCHRNLKRPDQFKHEGG